MLLISRTYWHFWHVMLLRCGDVFDWQALDRAITDRVDEVIEFAAPGEKEREAMLKHYYNHYIVRDTCVRACVCM
jgi:AAA+ superfamily predicted ATPase